MDLKKLILAVLSFILPIVGIILYFVYKPKKDAQLFGLLAVIAIVLGLVGRVLGLF